MARDASIDYLLDDNGDLSFKNGDLDYGDADQQHVKDTIYSEPGWWKQYPNDGVGIRKYLLGKLDSQRLSREIQLQLRVDGYRTYPKPSVEIDNNGQVQVYPNAEKI